MLEPKKVSGTLENKREGNMVTERQVTRGDQELGRIRNLNLSVFTRRI